MIIKGRSPTMRHVSRTQRVALDSLFDRINLDPKIQIKYVDTKNQLADMLTKGSFTRDEWNHHLRLLNIMNFSMFSCSHFSKFLSYPIRKQSAMSNRRQEGTSEESSPMAKSRFMKSAIVTSRPMNLVSHSLLSEGNNSSPHMSDSNTLGIPKWSKVVSHAALGNWRETRAWIQLSSLKWGNRKTLNTQNADPWKDARCGDTQGQVKDGIS